MRKFFRRISALLHRRKLERQLEEEMAAHREMMPPDRRPHFGSSLRLREEAADQWGFAWLDQLRQDLAYGARSLRRSPGFALTAIAVLSLGIGVNLAEIQVFQALIHRLQVRDVDSLYRFFRIAKAGSMSGVSVPAIDFYRRHNVSLSAVIAETSVPGVFQADDSEGLRCSVVSGNYFTELGIAPLYGRLLDQQDDRPGEPPVAVLGYGYWQSRFAGDPGIVTKSIRLNGKPVQVIGIAPSYFGGVVQQPAPLWIPLAQYPYLTGDLQTLTDYAIQRVNMLGRIKPNVSREAAQAEFRSLTAQLRNQHPEAAETGEWLRLQPADATPNMKIEAVVLIATCTLLTLLVLLSACANLGNMLLARGLAREREIEVRLAIGASRWRLVRQLMTESFLLASLASVAALGIGKLAADLLLRIIAAPHLRITTDWRVVLASVALGLGSTLAFGLAPAFQAVKRGPRATRARKVLVSVQVAVSCLLLILSSFFTRAAQQSFQTHLTFDLPGMMLVDPEFYLHNYTAPQARQISARLAEHLSRLPGIDAVSIATIPPFRRSHIEHVAAGELYLNGVDSSYFALLRVPVLQGRPFRPGEPDALVVSESAARKLWPGASPLGKTCLIAKRLHTVTGVVKDSGVNLVNNPESVEAFTPIDDADAIYSTILLHAAAGSGQTAGVLRSAAALPGIVPMVYMLQSSLEGQRENLRKTLTVVSSLGAIASLLAMLGIFGLLAFTVAQRTREIGVRMALGARRWDVLHCVLAQYALPFTLGTSGGVLLSIGAAKVVRNILFGFLPLDPISLGAGLLVFAAAAIAASIAPARRALRIHPSSALRYE